MMLNFSRSKTLTLVGLIAIVGVGCNIIEQASFAPEQMLRQFVQSTCSPSQSQLENLRILGSRDWEHGKTVVYQAICRSNNPQQPTLDVMGNALFVRPRWKWLFISGGSTGQPVNNASLQELVDFTTSQSSHQGKPYASVYGRILNSQVTAIEAQFSNGKILRDNGQDNIFALIETDATQVCQVRLLEADGKVLKTYQISSACSAR